MAFTPTYNSNQATDTSTSNKHFLGDVYIMDALHMYDDTTLQVGNDFCVTGSELKQLLNYLKSIHPEAFI